MAFAVDAADAGQAGEVAEFVHICGVERKCGAAVLLRERPGKHHAEFRGMLGASHRRHGVIIELAVDARHAAGLRMRATAAPGERINRRRVDAFLSQHVQDDVLPERLLVVDVRIFQQDRRFMEYAFLEN